MSQDIAVMAFRKRAKSMGYTEISIVKIDGVKDGKSPLYLVKAKEPLAGQFVTVQCTAMEMRHFLRRVKQ